MKFKYLTICFFTVQAIAIYLTTVKPLNEYHQVVVGDLIFVGIILFIMYKKFYVKQQSPNEVKHE